MLADLHEVLIKGLVRWPLIFGDHCGNLPVAFNLKPLKSLLLF